MDGPSRLAFKAGGQHTGRPCGVSPMMPVIADLNGHNQRYFDRAPERLVLEGYRRWIAGFETGSIAPWELASALYDELLGTEEGPRAVADLARFVRALRKCAACPLRAFPFNAHHVSREECLTLGLIAALQHGDSETASLCAGAVTCPLRSTELAEAAKPFVETLTRLDHHLLPIPRRAIQDIMARTAGPATIH